METEIEPEGLKSPLNPERMVQEGCLVRGGVF